MNSTTSIKPKLDATPMDAAEISQTGKSHFTSLQVKVGFLDRWGASREESRLAGEAVRELNREVIDGKKSLALAAAKTTRALIQTNLVAGAMNSIGTSLVRLDTAAAAVDQGLTNAALASTATHLHNRASNHAVLDTLAAAQKVTADEAASVKNMADSDAYADIERSRERMLRSKEVVNELHTTALAGIARTKSTIASI
jgi:hypothetical protein